MYPRKKNADYIQAANDREMKKKRHHKAQYREWIQDWERKKKIVRALSHRTKEVIFFLVVVVTFTQYVYFDDTKKKDREK